MSRGPDGRYAYRADANARGAVPVMCWACGRDIPAEEPVYTDRQWGVMIGTTHDGRSVSWTEQHGPWCAQCAPGREGQPPVGELALACSPAHPFAAMRMVLTPVSRAPG